MSISSISRILSIPKGCKTFCTDVTYLYSFSIIVDRTPDIFNFTTRSPRIIHAYYCSICTVLKLGIYIFILSLYTMTMSPDLTLNQEDDKTFDSSASVIISAALILLDSSPAVLIIANLSRCPCACVLDITKVDSKPNKNVIKTNPLHQCFLK